MLNLRIETEGMLDLFYDQSNVWVKLEQDYGRDYPSYDKADNPDIKNYLAQLDSSTDFWVQDLERELALTKEQLKREEECVK